MKKQFTNLLNTVWPGRSALSHRTLQPVATWTCIAPLVYLALAAVEVTSMKTVHRRVQTYINDGHVDALHRMCP